MNSKNKMLDHVRCRSLKEVSRRSKFPYIISTRRKNPAHAGLSAVSKLVSMTVGELIEILDRISFVTGRRRAIEEGKREFAPRMSFLSLKD